MRANVAARARATEDDERTVAAAEAALAEYEALGANGGVASPHLATPAGAPADLSAPADLVHHLAVVDMGVHLSSQVAALAAEMRAHGARVGLGEVLGAERALAAVDASDRTEVFYALRAALCSTRAELSQFAIAFTVVFGSDEPAEPARRPRRDRQAGAAAGGGAAAGQRGARRRPHAGARRLERGGAAAREGLRRLHRGRAGDRAAAAGAARAARPAAALAADGADQAPPRRARPARHRARLAAPRRRAARAPLPRAGLPSAAARADLRRVGLDGAVLAHAAAVHAGLRRGTGARRGVRVRDAADAGHARAARPRLRPRAGARRGRGQRLVGRDADRRGDRAAQPRARPPDRPRVDGDPALGRLGPRRARAARGRDGAARAHRAPRHLAQPAGRRPALRAADARHESRDAARRPLAAGQLDRVAGDARGPDGGGHA